MIAKSLPLFFATLLLSSTAFSQELIKWTFENVSGPFPTGEQGFNTASDINLPGTLAISSVDGANRIDIPTNLSGASGSRAVVTVDTNGNALTQALQISPFTVVNGAPVSTSDYLTFDYSITAGFQLDISSLTYDLTVSDNNTVGGGLVLNTTVFLNSGSGFNTVGSSASLSTAEGASNSLAASITGFSTLTGSGEIRIAFGDNSSIGIPDGKGIYIDNIALNGTVSEVPEYSTSAALAGVLALAFVFLSRRE